MVGLEDQEVQEVVEVTLHQAHHKEEQEAQAIHLQFHQHKVILEEHQDLHQDHHMILHQEAQVEQVEQVAQVQMVLLEEQVALM